MNSLQTTLRRVVASHRTLPAIQQHAWMSSTSKKTYKKSIKGNRGSRGHGWYVKYREGRGGRSLQGEYWDRNNHHWDPQQWNDAVLSLGSQFVYLDVAVEPPSTVSSSSAAVVEEDVEDMIITEEEAGVKEEEENEWEAFKEPTPEETLKTEIKVERLVIQIASTVMPQTCINFIGLCQDSKYQDSVLYRIEKEVGICGGDVLTNTGRTGQCWQSFPPHARIPPRPRATTLRRDLPPPSDEPMALWHTAGMVTMLCPKVNEIDSRFLLCGQDAAHLDGIHRAFGRMEPESLEVVRNWQSSVITSFGKPKSVSLRIVNCGVLENYKAVEEASSSKPEEKVAVSSEVIKDEWN